MLESPCKLPPNPADQVGYLETTLYMRNQLLRDSDVMSMAHGLELRVPLVDRDVLQSTNQIVAALRYRPNKQLLLDAVPEVPSWVFQRPKSGFRFPFEEWVGRQWSGEFASVQNATQVPLGSWYRRWTLFTLEHFIRKNAISLSS